MRKYVTLTSEIGQVETEDTWFADPTKSVVAFLRDRVAEVANNGHTAAGIARSHKGEGGKFFDSNAREFVAELAAYEARQDWRETGDRERFRTAIRKLDVTEQPDSNLSIMAYDSRGMSDTASGDVEIPEPEGDDGLGDVVAILTVLSSILGIITFFSIRS